MRTAPPHPEGASVLHNMSAPPRSTLTLRPFAPCAAPLAAEGTHPTNWGMCWLLRVDIETSVCEAFPGLLPWDIADILHNPFLLGALSLARRRRGLAGDPDLLMGRSKENLADELTCLAPGPEEAAGLPVQMMATPAGREDRAIERDPGRILAVLTHLSGRVCDLSASPAVAEALLRATPLDLWAPENAHA